MKARKPSQKQILSSTDNIGPDDGVDPRNFIHKPLRARVNRKGLQLCTQIERTLSSVLMWESGDELLQCLTVESVEPAPDSSRVLVTVSVQASAPATDTNAILACLHRASGKLRGEVAAAIHRKRVPELIFCVTARRELST